MQQQDALTSDFESAPLETGHRSEDVVDVLLHACCERCKEITDKFVSYKKRMELNLRIIKEKIATTDELIKKYRKKCQENDQNTRKVAELNEKVEKCYSENGSLRVELEKSKAANEPLRKAAVRLENEKKLMDAHVQDLKSKLTDTQHHLEDVQASMSATDQMSSTLHGRLKQKEKDVISLESRLEKKEKACDKLVLQLKEARAARRQSELKAKQAAKEVEKIRNKLEYIAGDVSVEKGIRKKGREGKKTAGSRSTQKTTVRRTRSKSAKNSDKQGIKRKSKREAQLENRGSDLQSTSESGSDEDDEVAAIFENIDGKSPTKSDSFNTSDVLSNFAIPSPPLSPIPPSPAQFRRGRKTGASTEDGQKSGDGLQNGATPSIKRFVDLSSVNDLDDGDKDTNDINAIGGDSARGADDSDDDSDFDGEGSHLKQDRHSACGNVNRLETSLDSEINELPTVADSGILENSSSAASDEQVESCRSVDTGMAEMSGRIVDNILGVVSSDESDSDIDQSVDQSDALAEDDYSRFDSSELKYDSMNKSENISCHESNSREVDGIEKNRVESRSEDTKESVIEAWESLHIGNDGSRTSDVAKQSYNGTQNESDSTQNEAGNDMENLVTDEALNLPGISSIPKGVESPVSSRKDGLIDKQKNSSELGLKNNDALCSSVVEKPEEHSFSEISKTLCLKSDPLGKRSVETAFKPEKGECNRDDSEIGNNFGTCSEKAFKRPFESTGTAHLSAENVFKRSKTADNDVGLGGKESTDDKSVKSKACEVSTEANDICVAGDIDFTFGETSAQRQMEFSLLELAGAEGELLVEGEITDSCAASSKPVAANKDEGENSSSMSDTLLETEMRSTSATKNGSNVSEYFEEEVSHECKFQNVASSADVIVVQNAIVDEVVKLRKDLEMSFPLIPKDEIEVKREVASRSFNLTTRGGIVDHGSSQISVTESTDQECPSGMEPRRSNSTGIENEEKLDKCNSLEKQNLDNSGTVLNVKGILNEMPANDSEEKFNVDDRSREVRFNRSFQNPSSGLNDDCEVVSKNSLGSPCSPNGLQARNAGASTEGRITPPALNDLDIELLLNSIISEDAKKYPQISPLPPSPRGHRPKSISPLPVTPLPAILSPLVSPSDFVSPPSLEERSIDKDRLLGIAKPRAIQSSDSVRMLEFLSSDEEESELQRPSCGSSGRLNSHGNPISFTSSSFAFVSMQSEPSAKGKAASGEILDDKNDEDFGTKTLEKSLVEKPSYGVVADDKDGIVAKASGYGVIKTAGVQALQKKDCGEVRNESGNEVGLRDVSKAVENRSQYEENLSALSPTKRSLRKRKQVENEQLRSLRSSGRELGDRSKAVVKKVKASRAIKQSGECVGLEMCKELDSCVVLKRQEDKEAKRNLRSNTKIMDMGKEVRQIVKGRNAKSSKVRNNNLKEKQSGKLQRESGEVTSDCIVEKSNILKNVNNETVTIDKKKCGINEVMKSVTLELNNGKDAHHSSETTSGSISKPYTIVSEQCREGKEQPSKLSVDTCEMTRQWLAMQANSSRSDKEAPIAKEFSCRGNGETEVEYVQRCIEVLHDLDSLAEVMRQFSSIKNILSATSLVSAIVGYLKTNGIDNFVDICQRLHQNESNSADSSLMRDKLVDSFTKCPEIPKKEILIALVIEECAKVPHLNAIVKRSLHFIPKAVFREDRCSDESTLSLIRIFTAICRRQNDVEVLKEFLYEVAISLPLLGLLDKVAITCFSVWPEVFIDAYLAFDMAVARTNDVGSYAVFLSFQVLAIFQSSKREDSKISEILCVVFNWTSTGDDLLQLLCDALLTHLRSEELQKELETSKPGELLGPKAKNIIKSFYILLMHKGWKWCNNYLVGDHLWSIFRKWSQQQLPKGVMDGDKVNDATVVIAIRLIGQICGSAIKDGYSSFGVMVKMCSGILSRSTKTSLIPQHVQLAAAYTLLDISSVEPSTVLSQLSQWLQTTTSDIPKSLRLEIASLVVSEQF